MCSVSITLKGIMQANRTRTWKCWTGGPGWRGGLLVQGSNRKSISTQAALRAPSGLQACDSLHSHPKPARLVSEEHRSDPQRDAEPQPNNNFCMFH
jgi:hypothetical protein